ncbi:MAG: carbon storage regulator [Planctomycetota bacterium]
MLALTRRVGEEVVIGDPKNPLGRIRVVDIHGDKVRLAFAFDRSVAINRLELAEQKAKGEPKAETPSGGDA